MVVKALRRSVSTSSLLSSRSGKSTRSFLSNSTTSSYKSALNVGGQDGGSAQLDPELEALAIALQERLEEEGKVKERSGGALLFGGIKIPNAFVGSEATTILQELLQEKKDKEAKAITTTALHFVVEEEDSGDLSLPEGEGDGEKSTAAAPSKEGQVVTREEALSVGNKIAKEFGFFKRVTALSGSSSGSGSGGSGGDDPDNSSDSDSNGNNGSSQGIGITLMQQRKTKQFHLTDSKNDHYQFHNNLPSQVLAMKQQHKTYWDKMRLMEEHVECKDRWYFPRVYQDCFVAKDAVDTLMNLKIVRSRGEAVHLVRKLNQKVFCCQHVTSEHEFKDEYLFFRFVPKNERMPEPIRSKSPKRALSDKKKKKKGGSHGRKTKSHSPKRTTTKVKTTPATATTTTTTAAPATGSLPPTTNTTNKDLEAVVGAKDGDTNSNNNNNTTNNTKSRRIPRNSVESSHQRKIRLRRCAKSLPQNFDYNDSSNGDDHDNDSAGKSGHGSHTSLNTAPSLLGDLDPYEMMLEEEQEQQEEEVLEGPGDFLETIASGGGSTTTKETTTVPKTSSSSSDMHRKGSNNNIDTNASSSNLSPTKHKAKSTGMLNNNSNLTTVSPKGRKRANDIRARLANHHQERILNNKAKLTTQQLQIGKNNNNKKSNLIREQRDSILAEGRKSLEKAKTELIGISQQSKMMEDEDDEMPLPYHKNSMRVLQKTLPGGE